MLAVKQLRDLCLSRNISIAVAESCTAGLVSSNITSVSGSSKYFKGGIVVYQNETKMKILGITKELIDKKTEVSLEVAEQMAKNTLLYFNVDMSISTTGFLGPSGGTDINPVGTVFIAIANHRGAVVRRCSFIGDRLNVANEAAKEAILLLLGEIKKEK